MTPTQYFTHGYTFTRTWDDYFILAVLLYMAVLGVLLYIERPKHEPDRHSPPMAWIRAGLFFGGVLILSWSLGVFKTVVQSPLATSEQLGDVRWIAFTVFCFAVVVWAYVYWWPSRNADPWPQVISRADVDLWLRLGLLRRTAIPVALRDSRAVSVSAPGQRSRVCPAVIRIQHELSAGVVGHTCIAATQYKGDECRQGARRAQSILVVEPRLPGDLRQRGHLRHPVRLCVMCIGHSDENAPVLGRGRCQGVD